MTKTSGWMHKSAIQEPWEENKSKPKSKRCMTEQWHAQLKSQLKVHILGQRKLKKGTLWAWKSWDSEKGKTKDENPFILYTNLYNLRLTVKLHIIGTEPKQLNKSLENRIVLNHGPSLILTPEWYMHETEPK